MRKISFLLPAAGVVGIFLAACLSAPDEPGLTPDAGGPGVDSGSSCSLSGGREFNGACRTVCTSSSSCAAGESCMTVATGVSLCLDYSQCGYFANDTTCAGVATGAADTSYSGEDPYWVPGPDPEPYYTGGYGGVTPYGCAGNGPFLLEPPLAGDDPKCGEKHTVIRCEKVGNRCALVSGSTIDVAER